MSQLHDHRMAIVALLSGIPNIGIVHNRERYARNEHEFRAMYLFDPLGGDPQIRGWWIRRMETVESSADTGLPINAHIWQIRGFMAFSDANESELVLDELVEQFRAAVRADLTLGGVCHIGPVDETEGVQVLSAGPVTFAGVLCHSVTLGLKTWSYL